MRKEGALKVEEEYCYDIGRSSDLRKMEGHLNGGKIRKSLKKEKKETRKVEGLGVGC